MLPIDSGVKPCRLAVKEYGLVDSLRKSLTSNLYTEYASERNRISLHFGPVVKGLSVEATGIIGCYANCFPDVVRHQTKTSDKLYITPVMGFICRCKIQADK